MIKGFEPKFIDDKHKAFYEKWLQETHTKGDPEYMSLFYVLALNEITRTHIRDIFDFKEICIKPKGIFDNDWITGSTAKIIRFAYNMYNYNICTDIDHEGEHLIDTSGCYTPAALFACSYAPYFIQALKIRYPDYFMYTERV